MIIYYVTVIKLHIVPSTCRRRTSTRDFRTEIGTVTEYIIGPDRCLACVTAGGQHRRVVESVETGGKNSRQYYDTTQPSVTMCT